MFVHCPPGAVDLYAPHLAMLRKTFWTLSALSAVLGAIVMLVGVAGANGAPQEAAAAAIGIGLAVIPYCFNRALDEFDRPQTRKGRAAMLPPSKTSVRCNACNTIYPIHETQCPGCGAHRMDSVPV